MSDVVTTGHLTAGTVPPPEVACTATRVERRLQTLLEAERRRWSAVDDDLLVPLDALARAVLAGGKRLRPACCALGHAAVTGEANADDVSAVDDAGAAFELLHAFALVHDDVMDDAETRRGLPTPHARARDQHHAAGGRGESRRFGESVAMLVGDLAHVYADQLASGLSSSARRVWFEMQAELMMGQYLDVLRTAHGRAGRDQARRIATLKSGRYTIGRPLELGAALAGADPTVQARLRAYAEPLGLAFQLRDDVLGALGDAEEIGKPVGADLAEAKPTVLLATAYERATVGQRAVLDRVVAVDAGPDDVRAAQEVLVDTGARHEVEEEIERLTLDAVTALDAAPVRPEAAEALVALAWFVARREA